MQKLSLNIRSCYLTLVDFLYLSAGNTCFDILGYENGNDIDS